ncbi:hydroxymyristoyl-ACP dehydratase [Affinibrenneria salicis]|uniref:Hydroxymyristoyl-ACP dehydratase n=1 Tax=Affinibrenneria salicis TaxID=2590031 RepID=A0A5J5G4L0_9GAMM|nr:hydroxymyristoyl-ACP dehydratase [Affinibrenneria salicis]KAA9001938.1 hydroxymyristoyl-ACP dehydratase [Affinibrenneria salicis]
MLPVELARHLDGNQARLLLSVPPDLFWFRGHFPAQPLLPGVAQLDWVMHYGCLLLAAGWRFSRVDNIKFQQPIAPGRTLSLALEWRSDRQQLAFAYSLADGETEKTASSGKISLCR